MCLTRSLTEEACLQEKSQQN